MASSRHGDDGLNEQQRAFVREYLLDLEAKAAAIRAGYSPRSAHVTGCKLLKNRNVRAAVEKAKAARAHRVEVKADDVLRELLRVAMADVRQAFDGRGRLRPIHELPDDVARCLAGVEVEELLVGSGRDREQIGHVRKVKFWPKVSALELLGRHLGLLSEKHEHSGTVNIQIINPYAEARDAG